MIRFEPDTLRDALMRPIAMAAPDNGVYAEIPAPDLRFVAILLLLVVVLLARGRRRPQVTPLNAMLVWLVAAFVVWLSTTGNGRYFMPALLLAGPICIALAARLPGTPIFRAAAATGILALQGWTIVDNNPWGWWGYAVWNDPPFFDTRVDERARTEPATYVTIANISYSLILHKFAPESRFVNVTTLPDASDPGPESRRMRQLLEASPRIKLLVPTHFKYMDGLLPSAELQTEINDRLSGQRLKLTLPLDCRMLPSRGLAGTADKHLNSFKAETIAKFGFWICALDYPAPAPAPGRRPDREVEMLFEAVERQCPRFFSPGTQGGARIDNAWVRMYPHADIRLYVTDEGIVWYKYWRALNMERLGTADEIRAGRKLDCQQIRGRSGLPWERGI